MNLDAAVKTIYGRFPNEAVVNQPTYRFSDVRDDFKSQVDNFRTLVETIQLLPGLRVRLSCTSRETAHNIMAKGLNFRGWPVELEMARHERIVRIYRLPHEMPIHHTERVLREYGKVSQIEREYDDFFTGCIVAKLILEKAIPSKIEVCGQRGLAVYKGQIRTCFTCNSPEHENRNCPKRARNPDGNTRAPGRDVPQDQNVRVSEQNVAQKNGNAGIPTSHASEATAASAADGVSRENVVVPSPPSAQEILVQPLASSVVTADKSTTEELPNAVSIPAEGRKSGTNTITSASPLVGPQQTEESVSKEEPWQIVTRKSGRNNKNKKKPTTKPNESSQQPFESALSQRKRSHPPSGETPLPDTRSRRKRHADQGSEVRDTQTATAEVPLRDRSPLRKSLLTSSGNLTFSQVATPKSSTIPNPPFCPSDHDDFVDDGEFSPFEEN